jgi:protein phosphatase
MKLAIPADALVMLIGPSGSGKSTFASRHFAATEVLSSDAMRAVVADDPHDQTATDDAFELLHTALAMRLARRRLTVIDATNVEGWARQAPLAIARRQRRPAVAIVLALPLEVCLAHNLARESPRRPASIRRQYRLLTDTLATIEADGFDAIWILRSDEEVNAVRIDRTSPDVTSRADQSGRSLRP